MWLVKACQPFVPCRGGGVCSWLGNHPQGLTQIFHWAELRHSRLRGNDGLKENIGLTERHESLISFIAILKLTAPVGADVKTDRSFKVFGRRACGREAKQPYCGVLSTRILFGVIKP